MMSSIINFSKRILTASVCLIFFYSCNYTNSTDRLPVPEIQTGTAKVAGRVIDFQREEGKLLPDLSLSIPHPVTAEIAYYEATLNEDGSFFFEVPLESSPVVGFIQSEIYLGCVCLIAGEETQLEIFKDEDDNPKVNMVSSLGLTSDDMVNLVEVANDILLQNTYSGDENIQPEDYRIHIINRIDEIMKTVVDDNPKLSNQAKQFISKNYHLFYVGTDLFKYPRKMYHAFFNNPENEGKNEDDFIPPPEPDRSYYAFLKHFNLNDPLYLYADYYHIVLESILSNDTLNIPPIKDMPVKDWLKEVKIIMADLIGADTGLFYDMLAANAYAKQFKDENRPLSDRQKENIRSYFKNPSFTDILFAENDRIIQRAENHNINTHVVINKTPAVSKEDLMDEIISKYKGKVVLVDFWATWCGPCLAGMRKMNPLKEDFKDKNIEFVYISNTSSPVGIWEKEVYKIGGEHYYLTQEEWDYVLDSLDFSYIPSYLLYDSSGKLKNKSTGFPGVEKMQVMIEECLLEE